MNSISEGIVSKMSGANNELILTDARCLPGSEGGAVIMRRKKGRKYITFIIIHIICDFSCSIVSAPLTSVVYDVK